MCILRGTSDGGITEVIVNHGDEAIVRVWGSIFSKHVSEVQYQIQKCAHTATRCPFFHSLYSVLPGTAIEKAEGLSSRPVNIPTLLSKSPAWSEAARGNGTRR